MKMYCNISDKALYLLGHFETFQLTYLRVINGVILHFLSSAMHACNPMRIGYTLTGHNIRLNSLADNHGLHPILLRHHRTRA